MALTVSERQRLFRKRQNARHLRIETALRAIIAKLDGNEKPLAVELRAIAQEALQ